MTVFTRLLLLHISDSILLEYLKNEVDSLSKWGKKRGKCLRSTQNDKNNPEGRGFSSPSKLSSYKLWVRKTNRVSGRWRVITTGKYEPVQLRTAGPLGLFPLTPAPIVLNPVSLVPLASVYSININCQIRSPGTGSRILSEAIIHLV